MLEFPSFLHERISELVGIESFTASRKQLWAVVLGLTPKQDGDQWCILWGEDLQSGVAGFGSTPCAAMWDFEGAMSKELVKKKGG